ncbi:hypothetical protein P691DRAFT_721887 [Macrolepiota fuliginosa MF-IS2]|uniref:F-box domain-containing protein n=1 Tax=Macrolepiota fuliginosa MF-IS2 TaxID=1400762 RepID=A0A9P5XNQ4_9AGAR|nr:hypothetical protein P691DRAFT_721887 [Macrolepiota fuliginosa MF-IS2]
MQSEWRGQSNERPRKCQGLNEEADLEPVYAQICSHESAISIIDEEIGGLMRTIRQLQFRKWEHNEGIRHCKGLITLARRLPCEILANIFEICIRDGYTRTPLVVSRVCSQWRRAASIPSVWSHIYVDFDGRDPCGRTGFWLEKARNSFLDITLEIRQEQSKLPEVVGLLLGKRLQWRRLTINSSFLAEINRALVMCTGPLPEFRALDVSVQEFPDSNGQIEENGTRELIGLRTAFLEAPRFSTIRITRNILPAQNILPPSVTSLSLVLPSHHISLGLSMFSVLSILEELHHLEVFSMVLPPGQARHFDPDDDVGHLAILPRLVSLTLAGWPDINHLLPHLVASALKVLHLRSSDDLFGTPDEGTGRCLLQFLEYSSPPLEELELRDADMPAPYFIQCFARMNRLKALRLHESEISDLVLAELFGPRGLCPSLSTLDMRWCGHFRGRTLVDMIRSRVQPPATNIQDTVRSVCTSISKVTVINCSFVQKRDIADLAMLTLCQVVVVDPDDYCRAVGCCVNDRYRKRLAMEGFGRVGRLVL